jgi:hypothetical protein
VHTFLLERPEGKGLLGRPRHRRKDHIKMYHQEAGLGGNAWADLARDRDRWQAFVVAVLNLGIPLNAGNFSTSRGSVSFSGRTLLHGVICCKFHIFINKPALKYNLIPLQSCCFYHLN